MPSARCAMCSTTAGGFGNDCSRCRTSTAARPSASSGAPPAALHHYQATIRVTPVVDGDRAFVEWDATFDCEAGRREELTAFYRNAFATWLGSLDRAQ